MIVGKVAGIAAILMLIGSLGCSGGSDQGVDLGDEPFLASFNTEVGVVCVTASLSMISIARIVEGGECGIAYAQRGDSYQFAGDGFSLVATPPATAGPFPQSALAWYGPDGPAFVFLAHSPDKDEPTLVAGDRSDRIGMHRLITTERWSTLMWTVTEFVPNEGMELHIAGRIVPIILGDLGNGAVSGFSPLAEEILIGRPSD